MARSVIRVVGTITAAVAVAWLLLIYVFEPGIAKDRTEQAQRRQDAVAKAAGITVDRFYKAIWHEMTHSTSHPDDPDAALQDIVFKKRMPGMWKAAGRGVQNSPSWDQFNGSQDPFGSNRFVINPWGKENLEACEKDRKSGPKGTILIYATDVTGEEGHPDREITLLAFPDIQGGEPGVPMLMANGDISVVAASKAVEYFANHGEKISGVKVY